MQENKCPFSKSAYDRGKVLEVTGNKKDLLNYIKNWSDEYEVIVFKPRLFFFFYSYCLRIEKRLSKLDLIAIPNAKEKYILIQRLNELVEASNELLKTDYYDNYTRSQMKHVKRRRSLIKQ